MLRTQRLHIEGPDTFVLQLFCNRLSIQTIQNPVPLPHKSSNNLLAVEPETENDVARNFFLRLLMIFFG